jgi:diadenosine tetraphosphate (Ap4A) HIT family hydrolase
MSADSCPFCSYDSGRLIVESGSVIALWDGYPVSQGHALIVPKRHVSDWFDASREEKIAIIDIIELVKAEIEKVHRPDGYNVGFNSGRAAGQTVFHLHVHVIPRYDGDSPDPRGGVRWVIPEKAAYWDE